MSWCRRHTTRLLSGCVVAWLALLAVSTSLADLTTANTAPSYSTASIVNAATQTAETLAPNTIATVYGTNLAWTTHAVTAGDLNGGTLPTSLAGVSVYV